MNLYNIIFVLFYIVNVNSFTGSRNNKIKSLSLYQNKNPESIIPSNLSIVKTSKIPSIVSKSKSFMKLIRSNNIIPTMLLSFTGGWIINPSLWHLLHSQTFLVGSLNTLLVMSSSMVINDIFDVKIDRINNPKRPLVTGEITMKEAWVFTMFLLGLTEYLSFRYLPNHLRFIIHLSIANIVLYTPFTKRIMLLKNISCAALVSFASFFAGLSYIGGKNLISITAHKNIGLLILTTRFLFLGSLYNEILLDLKDYHGDKENNIYTLPVVYGKKITWYILQYLLG